jgi:poly-gamma-glutamate synthesis protein (capsule biosynthesis protein)
MSPENVWCLAAARPDVCALANNHVLDFGHSGLIDTLDTLTGAGIAAVGAGYDAGEAARPAIIEMAGGGRVTAFPSAPAPVAFPAAGPRRSGGRVCGCRAICPRPPPMRSSSGCGR